MTSQKNPVRVQIRTPKENGDPKRVRREYARKLRRNPSKDTPICAFVNGFYMG